MKKKILIIVENQPVPFDTRVMKEAVTLHQAGYEVTVLCPTGKGAARVHEIVEGIRIYRHPMPEEGNSALGYLWEYSCGAVLGVLVCLVDLPTARISCHSGLQPS